jgi:hypothetical protein
MYSKIFFFGWLIAIAVASLINYSAIGGLDLSSDFGSGFYLHIIGYFVAGALYLLAFGNKYKKSVIIAFLVLFMLGVLFEFVQKYIPSRTFNPNDMAANGLGLVGVYVCRKLIVRIPSRTHIDNHIN